MEGFARAGITMLVAALSFSAPLVGTFALVDGTPKVAAEMRVQQTPTKTMLDIFQTQGQSTKPILKYDLDMTKLMHLVIISDDFSQFMHLHPAFNAKTGHFTIALPLDPTRQYIAYVDTMPSGDGQQVFRFLLPAQQTAEMAVPAGQPTNRPIFASTPSPTATTAGPYTVKIQATTIAANVREAVNLTIERNGRPASDLHPYLGAAAHAVFIDTANLGYIHLHPMIKGAKSDMDMSMPGSMSMKDEGGPAKSGPQMVMDVPDLPVGTYKMWLQFEGGSKLYTAAFTIAVR